MSMKQTMCEFVHGVNCKEVAEFIGAIVRCRDCKFCHKNYCEKRISPTVSPSEIYWIPVEPDGFCKWGERREDD